MGRTPEYWLQHMGRERTIQAALRLHHDARRTYRYCRSWRLDIVAAGD